MEMEGGSSEGTRLGITGYVHSLALHQVMRLEPSQGSLGLDSISQK